MHEALAAVLKCFEKTADSDIRSKDCYKVSTITFKEIILSGTRYSSADLLPSVCLSVRLSVCLSVCPPFFTTFPMSDHHEIAMVDASWKK